MTRFFLVLSLCLGLGVLRAGADEAADLATIRARYIRWVLAGEGDDQFPLGEKRRQAAVADASAALASAKANTWTEASPALYDTTKRGADEAELRRLITEILPRLSIGYQLPGSTQSPNPYYHDEGVKQVIFETFDRLRARGFRARMHLPWKAAQVKQRDTAQAFIVDFILRTSGYALATFLMRDELRATGRLDAAVATCWEIERHPEKVGDMRALYLQADAIRVVLNVSLPAALAEGNLPRLQQLVAQLHRSTLPEANVLDTIKPDGLGHHHLGVYPTGYASYSMSEVAFAAWLLHGTSVACTAETIANVAHGLETLRVISQKYDMHKALSGRLTPSPEVASVLLGYACLADFPHPKQREFQAMLARLADDTFMRSDLLRRAFGVSRNEIPPGPGAIAQFMRVREAANALGAEPDPQGHWSLNYGPLAVHRRDDWMVSVKGYSRYWWAFERQLTDARRDPNQENVFGFHDGSASMMIFSQGKPWITAEASGYRAAGWDWSRIPGTTTRYLTAEELLAMDQKKDRFNRPYSDATFVGGVTLEDRYGAFVMDYTEATPDERSAPLRAMKSLFFFDDQIVCLTSGIRGGDGVHSVSTNLFQTALTSADQPTFVQGKVQTRLNGAPETFSRGAVQLVDAAGNGYFIPAGGKVVVSRGEQESMDSSARRHTKGNFATAWLDHGASPDQATAEYVVLVRSGEKGLENFAANAAKEYSVLRCDATAHIVTQHRLGLTGYAVIRAGVSLGDPVVDQASAPCLIMTRQLPDGALSVSVCNPDFGWKRGVQYAIRPGDVEGPPMLPVPTPVRLSLNGDWTLRNPPAGASSVKQGTRTVLTLPCQDAASFGFVIDHPSAR